MSEPDGGVKPTRADKWLWAVRAFKTRSQATDACKRGQVRVGGNKIKPSRPLHAGLIIEVERGQLTRTLRFIAPIEKRVSAKIVTDYCEDLTPPEAYIAAADASRQMRQNKVFNMPGQGKPTRRQLEKIRQFLYPEDDEPDEE